MLDYDDEARSYDETRGGAPRAAAAARALERLLPQGPGTVLDLACGTGIVTERLVRPGRRVVGVDLSTGMLGVAAGRVPGGVVCADATRLPLADGGVDAVVMVWLLHLLPEPVAEAVFAEAARVVRPGGVVVTTVDKNGAQLAAGSDIARVTAELRRRHVPRASDGFGRVRGWAAERGLGVVGETVFPGTGQGRSPRRWLAEIASGHVPWAADAPEGEAAEVGRRLLALPGQDVARPDPLYRVVALGREDGEDVKVPGA
ncbi:class I SAM-dependent methyltransferase [Kitasatospora sp. NPDC051853]|uniref:class I SAM-dependent methyltransferase n=1 Tax=Kitasatospora sp. NPDC051853 TaxID=3364058 RepID=UPI0037B68BC1